MVLDNPKHASATLTPPLMPRWIALRYALARFVSGTLWASSNNSKKVVDFAPNRKAAYSFSARPKDSGASEVGVKSPMVFFVMAATTMSPTTMPLAST